MHGNEQDVIVVAELPELCPQQRPRLDVPRPLVLARNLTHHVRDARLLLQVTRVGKIDRPLDEGLDALHRHAIDRMERRAKALVPAHDFVQASRERVEIELAGKADRPPDVERRAQRPELVQKPDALLRERQWKRRTLTVLADDLLPGGLLAMASADAAREASALLVSKVFETLFRVSEHSGSPRLLARLTCGHVLTCADAGLTPIEQEPDPSLRRRQIGLK